MSYEPFLIAPFQTGLDLDLDPWIMPEDAWAETRNVHIHHGVIEKRLGYRLIAKAYETNSDLSITAATQTDPVQLTLTDVSSLSDGDTIQVQYASGMTELNGEAFLVANKTGGAGGTIELQDLNGNDIDGTGYGAYSGDGYVTTPANRRIMGIGRSYDDQGLRNTIVWDTERGYALDKTTSTLLPYETGDILSGGQYDYIQYCTWNSVANTSATPLNRIYFTNGLAYDGGTATNGIRFYPTSTLPEGPTFPQTAASSLFRPTINGSTTIDGAKFVFTLRQRLILLGTIEGGQAYAQRMRWCASRRPGTPGSFTDEWDDNTPGLGGFVDAPTAESIVSANYLQDNIVVFFTNSVWIVRPTTDPRLPFRWEKLNSFRGADARQAALDYDEYVLSVSYRGITITDGRQTKRIDQRVERFVSDLINGDEFKKTYTSRNFQLTRTWILYSGGDDDGSGGEVNAALILDEDRGAWTIYDIAMNVLGHGQLGVDLALNDFPDSPQSLNPYNLPIYLNHEQYGAGNETIQDFHWESDDELLLGGDINGNVYVMDDGATDNESLISFSMTSAAWNPYKSQGTECELGYVDLLIDTDIDTTFVVEFYKDSSDNPYAVVPVDALTDIYEIGRILEASPLDDPTDGYTFESAKHGLSTGDQVYFYLMNGPGFFNGNQYEVTVVDDNTFEVREDLTGNGTAITAITQAIPAEVTATGHPFANGDEVVIAGGDMTQVIGNVYTVANATVNTFELQGVDSTGFSPYTTGGFVYPFYQGGGIITELPLTQNKIWKRVFAGGVGFEHQVKILQENKNSPFRLHASMPWFKRTGRRVI